MNNIEQIKEALSKATPGPWSKEGCELWHRGESYGGDSPHAYIGDLKMMQDRNAHLIAQAPTWLAYLIDELEKAQKEIHQMREAMIDVAENTGRLENWAKERLLESLFSTDACPTE